MITIRNTQRLYTINVKKFQEDAQYCLDLLDYADFDLGVWFTSETTIRRFNRDYRQKDKPTDIISFPFYPELKAGERIKPADEDGYNLGDIIIAPAYVQKDAAAQGISLEERLEIILVHGICHLLGYDHYTADTDVVMLDKEEWLLNKLHKKNS